MKSIDTHELAWAAGFIDGEGYFGYRVVNGPTRGSPYANLNIHQVDRRVLDRVKRALQIGKVDGPYGPYSGNRQAHYQYVLGSFEGFQAAIAMLWKWLGPVKRKQASIALKSYVKLSRELKANPIYGGKPCVYKTV